jgi:hypothetical protein
VMVGGLLAGGVASFGAGSCGPGTGTTVFPAHDGSFDSSTASVDLELNCGTATVSVATGSAWRVEGENEVGVGPTVDSTGSSLSVRSRNGNDGPFDLFGKRESWRITLPDATQLDTQLTLNAGSSTVNLAGANLGRLEATVNAGSATFDLGLVHQIDEIQIGLNAGSLDLTLPNLSISGSIEVNAGSVQLCAPPGAGLRLRTDQNIVASYNFDGHGLVKSGSTWETPGFDAAPVKIELHAHATAGSFSLNPVDGCGV